MIKLLDSENTGLLIIDVQEKLLPAISEREKTIDNIIRLLHLSRLFSLPILLTEQNPEKIGSTLPRIKELLPAYQPIPKLHFDCCDVDAFNELLKAKRLKSIVVTGVESHICLFQTTVSLIAKGYHVQIPQDAVGSRTEENRQVGINLMKEAGAVITSTEAIIYQILKQAGTDEFRDMLKLVK